MAVIAVESAVKYSFVSRSMQTRLKGQYKAELTLWPCLCVKPLITAITAIWPQYTVYFGKTNLVLEHTGWYH